MKEIVPCKISSGWLTDGLQDRRIYPRWGICKLAVGQTIDISHCGLLYRGRNTLILSRCVILSHKTMTFSSIRHVLWRKDHHMMGIKNFLSSKGHTQEYYLLLCVHHKQLTYMCYWRRLPSRFKSVTSIPEWTPISNFLEMVDNCYYFWQWCYQAHNECGS